VRIEISLGNLKKFIQGCIGEAHNAAYPALNYDHLTREEKQVFNDVLYWLELEQIEREIDSIKSKSIQEHYNIKIINEN